MLKLNEPVPCPLTKVYPSRGPIQQFRFADASSFVCFRCEQAKKSKLIAVYSQDWSKCLCNGCYRHLLSIYKVKAGTQTDDARAESLGITLLAAVSADTKREAQRILGCRSAAEHRIVLIVSSPSLVGLMAFITARSGFH